MRQCAGRAVRQGRAGQGRGCWGHNCRAGVASVGLAAATGVAGACCSAPSHSSNIAHWRRRRGACFDAREPSFGGASVGLAMVRTLARPRARSHRFGGGGVVCFDELWRGVRQPSHGSTIGAARVAPRVPHVAIAGGGMAPHEPSIGGVSVGLAMVRTLAAAATGVAPVVPHVA